MLGKFKDLGQKMFEAGLIRFGYIDVLVNDHKFIKDEILPYFLIYVGERWEEPFGL